MGEHSGVGISMVSLDLGEGYIDSGKEGGEGVLLYVCTREMILTTPRQEGETYIFTPYT